MTMTATARRLGSSRAVRIGMAIGLGMTARAIATRATANVPAGLVDWERAERIARRRLRNVPGHLTPAQLRATEPAYARHMDRVVPLLEERLDAKLPGVVERHAVVSRGEWAVANMVTFKALIGHLEPHLAPGLPEGSVRAGVAAATNRLVTTGQVGFLLGYLGSRVLGQYDVAMLSAEQEPGRLLYVEENIRATARLVKVPLDDFRLWVALHETTHAFELEAHPWLRPYLRGRMERQVALFARETRRTPAPWPGAPRPTLALSGGGRLAPRVPGTRATPVVQGNPARDEPHGGLQRLGHGPGRRRALARRRSHP